MSPPICHRTLGSAVVAHVDGVRRDHEPIGWACRGSACALWVPEGETGTGSYPAYQQDGRSLAPTGRGWCADNRLREPWPDPAAPKAGGAS